MFRSDHGETFNHSVAVVVDVLGDRLGLIDQTVRNFFFLRQEGIGVDKAADDLFKGCGRGVFGGASTVSP